MDTTPAKIHEQRRSPAPSTDPIQLTVAAAELLERAGDLRSGRAAQNLIPGPGAPLTQSLIALRAGVQLQEHTSPGPASIQVLSGTVILEVSGHRQTLTAGDWHPVPVIRHELEAVSDAVVLLTVAAASGPPAGAAEGAGS